MSLTFLETPRFPGCPSFGYLSRPEYSVSAVERASGVESRNRNWSLPLHRFTMTVGPRVEAEIQELLDWWHAVGGAAYGFRFKDAADYKSCRAGLEPTASDCPLVPLGTTPETYQMVKRYTIGALSQDREIYKPVEDTIMIADGGVAVSESSYTVDYTLGIVSFGYVPSGLLTWGGEFDVPVRFDSEFPVEIQNRKIESVSFELRELRRANLE